MSKITKSVPSEQLFSLEDKTIIVTGGYGHLGSTMAKTLAEFGATVIVLGRHQAKLDTFLKKTTIKGNGTLQGYVCDVTSEQNFKELVEKVLDQHHSIDVLINNAYGKQYETFDELTIDLWHSALDAELTHYFTCIKAVSKQMIQQKQGSIINVASIYGSLGTDQRIFAPIERKSPIHYSVSKGGILQLTRYLATLWGEHNIRVNAISPGHFPPKRGPENPAYMKELTTRVPLGRIGQPPDLAGVTVLLASDASSYITGQNFIVDGGWSVW